MTARLVVFVFMFLASGCFEAIEHEAPVDAGTDAGVVCGSNDDCLCGERCAEHVCTPFQPLTCLQTHDCTSPLVCRPSHRAAHDCGYLECQP